MRHGGLRHRQVVPAACRYVHTAHRDVAHTADGDRGRVGRPPVGCHRDGCVGAMVKATGRDAVGGAHRHGVGRNRDGNRDGRSCWHMSLEGKHKTNVTIFPFNPSGINQNIKNIYIRQMMAPEASIF